MIVILISTYTIQKLLLVSLPRNDKEKKIKLISRKKED